MKNLNTIPLTAQVCVKQEVEQLTGNVYWHSSDNAFSLFQSYFAFSPCGTS